MNTCTQLTPVPNAASISFLLARAKPTTSHERPAFATAATDSHSPVEAIGKPASIASTPSLSSCLAILTFSSGVRDTPGVCSPSLKVVSKIRTGC